METVSLSGKCRHKAGKGLCNAHRKSGMIPGVLYGREHSNMLVEFSEMDLNDVIKNYGEHALINLDVDGKNVKAMIKEVQREPVNRHLIHVDMKYIKDDEKVHADIPVIIKGEDYVKSNGGAVQKQLTHISVEANPMSLPKFLVADVSKLKAGEKFTVSDMELSTDISVMTDMLSVIVSVSPLLEKQTLSDSDESQMQDSLHV